MATATYSDIAGTRRQQYERTKASLLLERSSFDAVWKDFDTYIWPGRSRFQNSDRGKGIRRDQKVINSTATYCADILQSGMQSGNTNPSSDWLQLTVADSELAESSRVKAWLHTVTKRMLALFQRSNLYTAFPTLYGDMGIFGTACASVLRDERSGLIAKPFPIGSYVLGVNSRGHVDTFIRDYQMTVRQIVEDYVWDRETGDMDWSHASVALKNAWDRGNKEDLIDVCWIIQPNPEANPDKLAPKYLPWSSCHFESGQDENKFLRESGFRNFPIIAPRWFVGPEEIYGTDCPGRKAIGHTRSLQLKERRLAQAIEKLVSPPLQAPTHLQNQKVSSLPGDVSYADASQLSQGIKPIYQIDPRVGEMNDSIAKTEDQIRQAFYTNLFLMFEAIERGDVTATEILERKQEKLLTLSPVVERMKDDGLDPLVDLGYAILEENGEIPEPPEELEGMALKVEYLGVFSQAQRSAGVGKLDRFIASVIPVVQIDPSAAFKVDWDQVVDEYHAVGINPAVIRSDEDAAVLRQQAQQAAAEQRQAELAAMTAKAGKDLGTTPMEGDTALNRMLEGATQ